jgi:hypothetical protein
VRAEDAEAAAAAWFEQMRSGDFDAAWDISARLLRARAGATSDHLPRHYRWIWDGRPIDGARVLVRCYHGLGDTIHFIRYAPLLRARAREVIVWAQPPLIPLLRGLPGIDRLLPLHEGAPDADFDVDLEVMELPFVFRTTVDTVPATVPYLRIQPDALPRPGGPAVGLVWRAGDWAEHRSIPFSELQPLFDLPVTWYVLQGGPGLGERTPGFGRLRGTGDLVELARAVADLDLMITVDSMPAHLAGALGVQTWTLLAHAPDWRWMTDREDTPWYPTMRLIRQEQPGDWRGVIARLRGDLDTLLRG